MYSCILYLYTIQLYNYIGRLTSCPVEGGQVCSCQPVDGLGQDEYGREGDDPDHDEGGGVDVVKVEEVGDAIEVSSEERVDGAEGDGEEWHGECQAKLR